MADGDCNDLAGNTHPDAADPYLSSNRLYLITTARGDSFVTTERTTDYATLPSYLEFDIIDENGDPVEGALITIFGTWEVYGNPNSWTWAGELTTDRAGHAETAVGEYNRYGYAVYSDIGNAQAPEQMCGITETLLPYETAALEVDVQGELPGRPAATGADLLGGTAPSVSLEVAIEVDGHRLRGDGAFVGSFSLDGEGGDVDLLVLDEDGYQAFLDGAAMDAQVAEHAVEQTHSVHDLTLDKDWVIVLSNAHSLATTVLGDLSLTASSIPGYGWEGAPVTLEHRFRIPPGEHVAIRLDP
jgi:hypothetical protein